MREYNHLKKQSTDSPKRDHLHLKIVPETDEFDQMDMRGGGVPDDMGPDDYVIECFGYESWKYRGVITAVVLNYITTDGAWRDVVLKQWLPLYPGKPVNPGTKTWRHWALALGHPPKRGSKFHPRVFVGKRFVAQVGYSSKNERSRAFHQENTQRKKYDDDRLRVHELKSVVP